MNKVIEFIANVDNWSALVDIIIKVILVLVLSKIAIMIGKKLITKIFLVRSKSPLRINQRREATLVKLLENILTYVIYFIATIMILEYCHLPVKGVLAGAGILGLAVGFGAQSLVKDIISGFFIIFEDQFSVGDYVKINTFEGEVLEIGLRTTKIKSKNGELHLIPNGGITQVTNYSILNGLSTIDVTIANDNQVELVEQLLANKLAGIETREAAIVQAPKIIGIESLNFEEVVLRIETETEPMKANEVSRVIRKEIRDILIENQINSTSTIVEEG